jgi:hypothetical protein
MSATTRAFCPGSKKRVSRRKPNLLLSQSEATAKACEAKGLIRCSMQPAVCLSIFRTGHAHGTLINAKWNGPENGTVPHAPCKRQGYDGSLRSGRDACKTPSAAQCCWVIGPKWTHAAKIKYRKLLICNGWALNSAVECHLHTLISFNPLNNLTRLYETAKYL